MNLQKLDTRAVKSEKATDKQASSSASLRVRAGVKAGYGFYDSV